MDEPRQPLVKFSLSLKKDADPSSIISQLEELVGKELHIIDVRRIDSISQAVLKCSASANAYQDYFSSSGQKQNLPPELYSLIEDIIPDRGYLHN